MQTRDYSDLLELIEALCGVSFANIELPRIKALINRRAKKAYKQSNYWPRFLNVGEERTVTDGVVPTDAVECIKCVLSGQECVSLTTAPVAGDDCATPYYRVWSPIERAAICETPQPGFIWSADDTYPDAADVTLG